MTLLNLFLDIAPRRRFHRPDSINSMADNFGQTTATDEGSIMLFTIIAVLFALCICFYFVLSYRKMQNRKIYA